MEFEKDREEWNNGKFLKLCKIEMSTMLVNLFC